MTPTEITPRYLLDHPLPKHDGAGSKDARGRVLIVAGHREMPGAALLAGLGALRAGAGAVHLITTRTTASLLAVAFPEARVTGVDETAGGDLDPSAGEAIATLAEKSDAILIGPGLVDEAAVAQLIAPLLALGETPPLVLDAAAFTCLRQRLSNSNVVVTPHTGESAKFLGLPREDIDRDPLHAACQVTEKLNAITAMKGAKTYIVNSKGEAWLSDHGTIGLGISGSGDTLAGIITGLLARGTEPALATAWGVYMHAEAGQRLSARRPLGFLAREILDEIPQIMVDFADPSFASH